jgi:AcrR family transcriptional regulator
MPSAKRQPPDSTHEPVPSTVERRQERARQRLFEVAGQLFEENGGEDGRGFEDTTVEAIADRADISIRTFFRFFESKTDVIYLDLRRSMEEYFRCLDRRLAAGGDAMAAALLARHDQITAFALDPINRQRLLRSLRSRHFVSRRAVWYSQLQAGLEERLLAHLAGPDRQTEASLIAGMTVKLGEIGLHHWAHSGGRGDPASYIAEAFERAQQRFARTGDVFSLLGRPKAIARVPRALAARRRSAPKPG